MRLVERLARLERAGDHDLGMSAVEIDVAAARYEDELVADGPSTRESVVSGLAIWRQLVEQAAGTWQQRVWAGISPADLTL